jgi:hypothetical protein
MEYEGYHFVVKKREKKRQTIPVCQRCELGCMSEERNLLESLASL